MLPRPEGEPEPFDMDAFKEDVSEYCLRQGIDYLELAARAGVARASVLKFLRGQRGLGLRSVCLLAYACDLSLDRYLRDLEAT